MECGLTDHNGWTTGPCVKKAGMQKTEIILPGTVLDDQT